MSNDSPFVVRPVAENAGDGHWVPTLGPEVQDFLYTMVPQDSRRTVRAAAVSILAKGIPPTVIGQETGLVIGYVQSGKTMSFEAVAALARDNAFQIVIVIAGRSNPLLDQSTSRLYQDFKINDSTSSRHWVPFRNPPNDGATIQALRDVLADWRDPGTPSFYKRTALITVLKNYRHLQNLADVIAGVDMHKISALIIDDEGGPG